MICFHAPPVPCLQWQWVRCGRLRHPVTTLERPPVFLTIPLRSGWPLLTIKKAILASMPALSFLGPAAAHFPAPSRLSVYRVIGVWQHESSQLGAGELAVQRPRRENGATVRASGLIPHTPPSGAYPYPLQIVPLHPFKSIGLSLQGFVLFASLL